MPELLPLPLRRMSYLLSPVTCLSYWENTSSRGRLLNPTYSIAILVDFLDLQALHFKQNLIMNANATLNQRSSLQCQLRIVL